MSAPNQGGQPPDLSHLQDNFNEQQAKITALKELVRQSEQSGAGGSNQDAQEKVKSIAQRLNVLKSKATKSRLEKSSSEMDTTPMYHPDTSLDVSHNESLPRSRAETPGSEKIQLLRQQMELNRRKMAERESSKRDIEVMVSQLKARFDDTQQSLHRSAELGRSMGDLSSIGGAGHSTDRDRVRQLEAKVRILEAELADSHNPRVKELQTKILDLEETIREKDSLIQARTQAVTLMTENMSMKGKNTVDLLEDTQQEMVRMQENFIHEEMSRNDEIAELKQRLTEREGKIANLEEVVDILETTRYDLTVKNAELLNQLTDVQDYSSKLEELQLLNQQLQKRIVDLEAEQPPATQELSLPTDDLQQQVIELKAHIERLSSSDWALKFSELEQSFSDQSARCAQLDDKLTEKCVELSVLQANYNVLDEKLQSSGPKSLFSSVAVDTDAEEAAGTSTAGEAEVLKLKSQLDDANKSQIKTKLKMKQMQKQMDSLRKSSDQNRQILALQDEVQQLQQKLSELGDDQQSDAIIVADDSDLGKKIQALEQTCHNQTAAINLLEEQKVDLADDLSETRAELESLRAQNSVRETSTVTSEISSIALEEQLELHIQDKATLTLQVEDLNEVVTSLKEQARKLKEEKVQLDAENQKLLEKLDKLSEKVSSAESIEILENLTHQERMEMESQAQDNEKEAKELSDDESQVEMSQKIELFTTERKEVLEKMERVQAENVDLSCRVTELEDKERQLLVEREELQAKCVSLEESVASVKTESKLLSEKVTMIERLEQSDSSLSSTPGTPQKGHQSVVDRDTLRESLKQLETEVDNYMKCKDKNGKLATSKKLAKQAKNCVTQFRDVVEREVTGEGSSSSSAEEIEKLKTMLIESTNIKVERDQLDEELRSVRTALLEANNAQEDQRGQITVLLGKLSQKDELLEEHERDTEKLLHDIKLLQETVQDNATAEEIQTLREVVERRDQELVAARKSLEDLQSQLTQASLELAQTAHELEEKERREGAFSVEKETMKELIEEQKKQLIEQLMDHEGELTKKVNEIQSLEEKLNQVLGDLEALRRSQGADQIEEKEAVSRLREELEFKQETIDSLNSQIMDLYKSMDGNTNALLEKEDEILELSQVIETNSEQLRVFEERCEEYERTIQEMEGRLRDVEEKHSKAANATDDVKIGLEQRIQELEAIVQELDGKNKEQLEKLKKFAVNLKKKVAQCNELEQQLKRQAEGGDTAEKDQLLEAKQRQIEEGQKKIQALEENVESLTEELNLREDEVAQAEGIAKEWKRKCQEIEREQERQRQTVQEEAVQKAASHAVEQQQKQENTSELLDKILQLEQALAETNQHFEEKDASMKELHASKVELEEKIAAMSGTLEVKVKEVEKCKILIKKRMKEIQELKQKQEADGKAVDQGANFAQEEVIQSLRSQVQELEHYRTQAQIYETKIQENALYIESLENEKRELDEKIRKLEEGIATIESRRNSMEQKVTVLGATLQEKSSEFQEHEDILVQRLSSLSAHDEVIMAQLSSIKQENEDLLESVEEHIKQEHSLQAKIVALEGELHRVREEVVANLEQEVQQLSYQLTQDSSEKRKHSEDLERRLHEKEKEIEDLESEMSGQFVKFEEERRALHEQQEKLLEDGAGQSEEVLQLRLSVADLEAVQRDLQEEVDRLRTQCDSLCQDDDEVKELRMQVVQDQTEIEHLRAQNLDLSQSHEQELDRLRCEIINLQENNQIDLLRADLERFQRELVVKEQEIASLHAKNEEAWRTLEAKNDLIDRLGTKVHDINEKQLTDFNDFSESMNAMKSELATKEEELANLNGEIARNAQIIGDLQTQLMRSSEAPVAIAGGDPQEVNELRRLLSEKDVEIANYQQRTLQLQMAASMGGSAAGDPFSAFAAGTPPQRATAAAATPQEDVERLKRDYEEKIVALQENLRSSADRMETLERVLKNLADQYSLQVPRQSLAAKEEDLEVLGRVLKDLAEKYSESQRERERLEQRVKEKEENLQSSQDRMETLERVLKNLADQYSQSQQDVQESEANAQSLAAKEEDFEVLGRALKSLADKYSQSQKALLESEGNLQRLAAKFQETQQVCLERSSEVERLRIEVEQLNEYLQREQSKQAIDEVVQVAQQQVLAAVPTLMQESQVPQQAAANVQENHGLLNELQSLREELQRVQMQLTEKCLELDVSLTRIREFEAAAAAKRDNQVKGGGEKKQVAQVSPQQVQESNIPTFATAAQFFDTFGQSIPPTGTSSFFDHPAAAAAQGILPSSHSLVGDRAAAVPSSSVDVPDYDSRVPVEEDMIVPQKAYVCFPDTPTQSHHQPELHQQPDSSSMTPNVDDSGWGWNAEEAILEEQHQRLTTGLGMGVTPRMSDERWQALEDKIQELELERDRQRNEIHEFQLKSAKMLKKLKEYKAVNENLSRQRSQVDVANDMDQFIQEELKEQVRVLESRLREDLERREKEGAEKEALGSRVAQLAASNAKLQEMRGAQELEIERHLTEIRHLRSELQKMNDWGAEDGASEEKKKPHVGLQGQGVGQEPSSAGQESASRRELESKITDLAADNDELQAMLEDEKETNRQLEERLRRVVQEKSSSGESEEQRRIAELEKQLKESIDLIDTLTRDSQEIKVHLDRLNSEQVEKTTENVKLQQQLDELAERNAEFANLVRREGSDESKSEELEQRIQNLVAEMEYKNSDNQQMREKLAAQAEAQEAAEENLRAKERVIENMKERVAELQDQLKAVEGEKEIRGNQPREEEESYQKLYEDLTAEKVAMEHELQVLNDQVLASLEMEDKMKATVLEFDLKQIEINELKATIDQLRAAKGGGGETQPLPVHDAVASSDSLQQQQKDQEIDQLRNQIDQLNRYWTDAVEQRGSEIAESWKTHLEQVQQDYEMRITGLEQQVNELLAKVAELEAVKQSSPEVMTPVAILPTDDVQQQSDDNDDLVAMKAALESQEMEIVTLKEQLAIRSAEFAALSARLDPYGHRATSNMASVQPKLGKQQQSGGGGGVAVSSMGPTPGGQGPSKKREQNELDLALYMLHQRDMRCEELTHELLFLLEERDTLQLKWSDCMRQLEGVRRGEGISGGASTTSGESTENNSPEKVTMSGDGGGGGGAAAVGAGPECGVAGDDLDAKLQSIHEGTVSRGLALRKERDERLQQMAKLQQDIANMPPEAVKEIVGGSYALSETNPSPSSVLLNWLWGKGGHAPKSDQ